MREPHLLSTFALLSDPHSAQLRNATTFAGRWKPIAPKDAKWLKNPGAERYRMAGADVVGPPDAVR